MRCAPAPSGDGPRPRAAACSVRIKLASHDARVFLWLTPHTLIYSARDEFLGQSHATSQKLLWENKDRTNHRHRVLRTEDTRPRPRRGFAVPSKSERSPPPPPHTHPGPCPRTRPAGDRWALKCPLTLRDCALPSRQLAGNLGGLLGHSAVFLEPPLLPSRPKPSAACSPRPPFLSVFPSRVLLLFDFLVTLFVTYFNVTTRMSFWKRKENFSGPPQLSSEKTRPCELLSNRKHLHLARLPGFSEHLQRHFWCKNQNPSTWRSNGRVPHRTLRDEKSNVNNPFYKCSKLPTDLLNRKTPTEHKIFFSFCKWISVVCFFPPF